jgi:hypothetical protein
MPISRRFAPSRNDQHAGNTKTTTTITTPRISDVLTDWRQRRKPLGWPAASLDRVATR